MAGDEGASSSGSTNFYGGEMHTEEMPRVATHGKRGITNLDQLKINDPGVSLFTMAPRGVGEASESEMVYVRVDSFPKGDLWMPALHGDDVESLLDNVVKELDEHRNNYTEFTGILEAHGCRCSSLEEKFLPCFKDEEELQHPLIRSEICRGIEEQQVPEQTGSVFSMKSTFASFFSYNMEQGHLVRPSTEELERCLDGIPEHLGEWKSIFKSVNDEAVGAVKHPDWEMACEHYEACLVLLEDIKDSISPHIQTWLLLWVCIPLAYLYQVRLGNYPKCVTLYDQLLQQLNQTDDTDLIELYYSIIWHRRMVLFQWSYAFEEVEDQLLAQYLRSRAFSEVQLVEDFGHFPGFIQLQWMINYWGRRTQRGLEGDMRVALCSNLENLYRKSKQWSEAAKWTEEKWRWIRTYSDVSHELNVQWRFDDVESLFNARKTEEAQRMIDVLEEDKNALQEEILYRIRFWKARFLRISSPIEADKQLQVLRADLEKKKVDLSDQKTNSKLLSLVKLEISMLNYQHRRHATILERAPVGVEEGEEWDDDFDTTAIDLLNNERSNNPLESSDDNHRFHRIQGEQLLMSLGKHFKAKNIEEYRKRVHEAADHFQKSLDLMPQVVDTVRCGDEIIGYEEVVDTLRSSSRFQILGYLSMGICSVYAHKLKPLGVEYNEDLEKEMMPSVEIVISCLNEAVEHLQISQALAESGGHDDLLPRISEILGWVHYLKAQQYYEWVKDFYERKSAFKTSFTDQNGNNKYEVNLFAEKKCGNRYHTHMYILGLSKDQVFCDYVQRLRDPDSSPLSAPASSSASSSSSSSASSFLSPPPFEQVRAMTIRAYWRGIGVVEQCLTDELFEKGLRLCFSGLIRQTVHEIKQSTDHFERGLKMQNWTQFDTSQEQNQLVPHFSMVETTKTMFTHLQRLILWEVSIKDMIEKDRKLQEILSFRADPVTAEFLHSECGDLTRKALLWAERGRSRSLMQQLLANKPLDKPIHDMVNFSMTDDQEAWNILKNSRLSCGENTVFVEYTFDATHEYVSDLIKFNRSVTWIVYVVTKDDKVHMRFNQTSSLSEISTALRDINKKLSEGAEDADADKVKKALKDLYDVFIKPIFDLIGGMNPKDKLVFAADEILTNMPFSILLNAESKYLFENHTISFTPSLWILAHCHQRLKSLQGSNMTVRPSVALGDPAYLHEKGRLKQSYFEVWNISPLFNTGKVKVLTGTEATVDKLVGLSKMPADTVQGFIHVAAHNHVDKNHKSGSLQLAHPSVQHQDPPSGKLSNRSDLSSKSNISAQRRTDDYDKVIELEEYLISEITNDFATLDVDVLGSVRRGGKDPAEAAKAAEAAARKARLKARQQKAKEAAEADAGKQSYLPSERIMQRGSEWRSYMVVLSACNSAKGYVLASEGVVGLPRAFLAAGAPCIVASQWELEDVSSSELMVEFYREMSRGRDTSSALREAMLRMMKPDVGSSDHVYKWGGYLVWGSPTATLPPSMMKKIDEERTG